MQSIKYHQLIKLNYQLTFHFAAFFSSSKRLSKFLKNSFGSTPNPLKGALFDVARAPFRGLGVG